MNDEKQMEETITEPSTEEKQPLPQGDVEEITEEKTVPYDRFKEVNDKMKSYRELLEIQDKSLTPAKAPTRQQEAQDFSEDTGSTLEDAYRIIDQRIEQKLSGELSKVNRKMDFEKTAGQYPDFFKYSENMKEIIKETPGLKWADAYKLAKFDEGQLEARNIGKEEAYRKIQEKKGASVEPASKNKSVPQPVDENIDPLARGADGKFLYTQKELEDILPKQETI